MNRGSEMAQRRHKRVRRPLSHLAISCIRGLEHHGGVVCVCDARGAIRGDSSWEPQNEKENMVRV